MNNPHTSTLAATLHDPEGRFPGLIDRLLPTLRASFDAIAVAATPTSSPLTVELLREREARVALTVLGEVGTSRRDALRLALEGAGEQIVYCDLDRVLHWAASYPDEIGPALQSARRHSYVVIGRTGRAFASHPLVQRQTEQIINQVFALRFGQAYDIAAGASAMSRAAAEAILERSTARGNVTDAEWPLIIAGLPGHSVGYLEVEGMEFETGDAYPDQIARAGSYEQWIAALSADPRAWIARTRLTLEYLEVMAPAPPQA